MNLTRRAILRMGAAGVGVLAATAWAGWAKRMKLGQLSDTYLDAYIRKNFDYLNLEVSDREMQQFVTLFREHYTPVYTELVHGLAHRFMGRRADGYREQMDFLCTTFLMSTNFFLQSPDESAPVHYITLFHPYVTPCWNPLTAKRA